MNKKMMAHPDLKRWISQYLAYWMHRLTPRPQSWATITVLAIVVFAVFVSYQTPVASANVAVSNNSATAEVANSVKAWTEVVHTPKGNCTLHFQQYDPGSKAVEDLLGPSYATIWTNQSKIPTTGPYQGMRGKDPWPGEERKAFVNLYEEVHLFWVGGTFVSATPRTTYCRDYLIKRYNNDGRSAVSRNTVQQVGLGLYGTDLR